LHYFEKALALAHSNHEDVYEINVLVNMALVHERKEDIENAVACLEEALKIDPQN
jgi:tetratricopeptide (TPR) repeat protein